MSLLKKVTLALTILLIPTLLSARNLVEGNIKSSGFGGPYVKFTSINSEFGVMAGGFGAWLINDQIAFGGGGCGLTTRHEVESSDTTPITYRIDFGYGGFYMGYIHSPSDILHLTGGLLIGAGGVDFSKQDDIDTHPNFGDGFFILEPEIGIEVNVVDHFRLDLNTSYRFLSGVEEQFGITDEDLMGITVTLALKFGDFR